MEEKQHTYLGKFTDFPLYVYIIGLFLLLLGISAQICMEIMSGLWNKPPEKWEQLRKELPRFIPPDLSSDDLQNKLDEICRPKPSDLSNIKEEEFCAGKDFPLCWPEWLRRKGARQRISWAARMNQAVSDYETSKNRLGDLKKILGDKTNRDFLFSREKYEEEKRIYEALKSKMEKLRIRTTEDDFNGMVIIYLLVVGISPLASSWYLYRLSKSHISLEVVMARWKLPFWVFFLILYLCQTGVVFYTSILKAEKSWIGSSSFFVSWEAWCFERVTVFGLSMITAIPITQLWCCLRKERIPKIPPIWLQRPDGRSAVERYVLFLQTWTLIIFGFFSVITIATVRWAASQQAQFERAYLFNTIVGVGIASLLIAKMIRNAIELRKRYQDSLLTTFDSWSAIRNANVPNDPTEDFIGKSWWKLPANFVGIITATWAVLEWTGVGKVIVGALK